MKKRYSIFLLIIIIAFCAYKSSSYRFSCADEKHTNLGKIDFISDVINTNAEEDELEIIFENSEEELIFTKNKTKVLDLETLRCNAYVTCEEIIQDKDPFTRYAYFEYKNLETSFIIKGGHLLIRPLLQNCGSKRQESLYINFSFYSVGHLKGEIPFYEIDKINENIGFKKLFIHYDHIDLNEDIELEDIWVFKQQFYKQQELGVFYSKNSGIIAIEINEKIFLRK